MENVTKGWKTSAIGIVVIIAAISSVLVKDVSWGDACIGITMGLGLLFSPDTWLNKIFNAKN